MKSFSESLLGARAVDPKKVKSGEIPPEKTPYMQRKGAWDNSDLAKKDPKVAKKRWSNADKAYATVGSVYLCIWCFSVELCVTFQPPSPPKTRRGCLLFVHDCC